MTVHYDILFRSELVTITDARCRPPDAGPCPVEASATDDLVIPRRGCFVRHVGRHRTVGDGSAGRSHVEHWILTGKIVERQKDRRTGEWKYLAKGKTLSDDEAVGVSS